MEKIDASKIKNALVCEAISLIHKQVQSSDIFVDYYGKINNLNWQVTHSRIYLNKIGIMNNLVADEKYNLLTACEKYGGENYLTETWAWILNNNRDFLSHYIKELFDISLDGADFNIKTQKHTRTVSTQGYIDLIVTTSDYCFIFEHKIDHSFGEDQILKYIDWARDTEGYLPEKIMSATISGYFIDHEETVKEAKMVIVNFLWHEVYKFISEKTLEEKYSEVDNFILKCFKNLLIKNGLTWIETEVNMEGLKSYYSALGVNQSLRDIFSNIREQYNWKSVYEKFHRSGNKKSPPRTPVERWGRIGIDLDREKGWSPSIFFGVVADLKDHKILPSNPELGPDLCLIIDIDKKRFGNYDLRFEYKDLKMYMQNWAAKGSAGWEFYDHFENPTNETNLWHPLYLRKPLHAVLGDANTPELQRKKIEEAMALLLDTMLSLGTTEETAFLKMKKAFKDYDQ